jgi:hypothetical protein
MSQPMTTPRARRWPQVGLALLLLALTCTGAAARLPEGFWQTPPLEPAVILARARAAPIHAQLRIAGPPGPHDVAGYCRMPMVVHQLFRGPEALRRGSRVEVFVTCDHLWPAQAEAGSLVPELGYPRMPFAALVPGALVEAYLDQVAGQPRFFAQRMLPIARLSETPRDPLPAE